MLPRAPVRLFTLVAAVSVSACTTGNVGGNVSTAPVTLPAGRGEPMAPVPAVVARGTPITASEPAALRGGVWVLTALGGSDVTRGARNPAHLSFSEATVVSGATGCNRLSGPVTIDAHAMRFGALVSTRMACVDGGDVEARFLAALEATRSWGLDSGTLHLRDEDGDTVATLEHHETLPGA